MTKKLCVCANCDTNNTKRLLFINFFFLFTRPLLTNEETYQPFWKTRWFTFIMSLHVFIIVLATIVIVNSMVHTLYFSTTTQSFEVRIGSVLQSFRLTSVATTNGDFFEKCAPAGVICDPDDKYRTYNGSCNNLQNPYWGAALTPFYRVANAEFSDGTA